jgi:hypothetical protein
MKSIWFFVGILLLVIGAIVLLAGIVGVASPGGHPTVLASLQPRLWWGALMVVAGILFLLTNRRPVE